MLKDITFHMPLCDFDIFAQIIFSNCCQILCFLILSSFFSLSPFLYILHFDNVLLVFLLHSDSFKLAGLQQILCCSCHSLWLSVTCTNLIALSSINWRLLIMCIMWPDIIFHFLISTVRHNSVNRKYVHCLIKISQSVRTRRDKQSIKRTQLRNYQLASLVSTSLQIINNNNKNNESPRV